MLSWGLLYLAIAVVTADPYYQHVSGYPPVSYNPSYPQYVTTDTFYNPYFFHLPHVYSHHLKPFAEPNNAQREIQVEDQIPASNNFARAISLEDEDEVDQGSASPVFLKYFHYKPVISQIIHAIVSHKHKKKDKNKNKDTNKEDIERDREDERDRENERELEKEDKVLEEGSVSSQEEEAGEE